MSVDAWLILSPTSGGIVSLGSVVLTMLANRHTNMSVVMVVLRKTWGFALINFFSGTLAGFIGALVFLFFTAEGHPKFVQEVANFRPFIWLAAGAVAGMLTRIPALLVTGVGLMRRKRKGAPNVDDDSTREADEARNAISMTLGGLASMFSFSAGITMRRILFEWYLIVSRPKGVLERAALNSISNLATSDPEGARFLGPATVQFFGTNGLRMPKNIRSCVEALRPDAGGSVETSAEEVRKLAWLLCEMGWLDEVNSQVQ